MELVTGRKAREESEKKNEGWILKFFDNPKRDEAEKNVEVEISSAISIKESDCISVDILELDNEEQRFTSKAPNTKERTNDFGDLDYFKQSISPDQIEQLVLKGPRHYGKEVRARMLADGIPLVFFEKFLPNGEIITREWLQWSPIKSAFFCFLCRLFSTKSEGQSSSFAKCSGFGVNNETSAKWKKLWDRVPQHETSPDHLQCSIQWLTLLNRLNQETTITQKLDQQLNDQIKHWTHILNSAHYCVSGTASINLILGLYHTLLYIS